jgi:hypothetical protein
MNGCQDSVRIEARGETRSSRFCGSLRSLSKVSYTPDIRMTLSLLLLACGGSSPSVTVETGAHSEASAPSQLTEVLDAQFRRPIENCYKEALKDESGLEGTVTYEVLGSHGILSPNVTGPGPDALQTCALKPMSNQRLLRILGDGDHTVGFTLTVNFSGG